MGTNIKNFREWEQRLNENWFDNVIRFFTGGSSSDETANKSKDVTQQDQNKVIVTPGSDPEKADPVLAKKNNFHLVPDKRQASSANYRSAQMTLKDLEYVIKKYNIKHIIRMNGDGIDSRTGVTRQQEEQLCKDLGCKFTFLDAHQGYTENSGYVTSIKQANEILKNGNTLVHCNHGADRTGYIVAAYLKEIGAIKDLDELWKYTTQYNGWTRMINNGTFFGSGYAKYADGFYPISKLKNNY
jgi:hypothetical protein